MITNEYFLKKAEAIAPKLFERKAFPVGEVTLKEDASKRLGWSAENIGTMDAFYEKEFKQDDVFVLDFGEHLVGKLTVKAVPKGSHADAPLRLKLTFGELPCDTAIPAESYEGVLARSWLQTEIITIDDLPCTYTIPRRFAFRYLRVELVGQSCWYRVSFPEIYCTATTAADVTKLQPLPEGTDPLLVKIDDAACRTLRDCMQEVVEDGVKRDRRFWGNDSHMGMIASYSTYHADDMAKYLLYLQAAFRHDDGHLCTCIFTKPTIEAGSEYIYDESAAFIGALRDYTVGTGDLSVLQDLWDSAKQELHLLLSHTLPNGLIDNWGYLIYWSNADKQTGVQAYVLQILQAYQTLAEKVNDKDELLYAQEAEKKLKQACLSQLYDKEKGLFVSGEDREISLQSQYHLVAAGVVTGEEAFALLQRAEAYPDIYPVESVITYAMQVQAYLLCGHKDIALERLKSYWGAMLYEGADTFFEHFNLSDRFPCDYHHILQDSYCHAYSSIAAHFIRNYFI